MFSSARFPSNIELRCGCIAWDQGSASTLPSLQGFQQQFGISSESAGSTRNFISLVYIGDAVGAGLSFLLNDRIGRLRSFRLYTLVWMLGQLIAMISPAASMLYVSRVVSGLGIGALSVTGTISIVEIAPAEIRGLLTAWYSVCMGIALMVSTFCVYGVQLHIATSRFQYQIVMLAPCMFMSIWVVASFFLCESPRWLLLSGDDKNAIETLTRLRSLPIDHPRVQEEFGGIKESIQAESMACGFTSSPSDIVSIAKETFTVPSNLRRVQQVLILYMLPQLSGGNSVTNYFIPILKVAGVAGDSSQNLFLNCMYTLTKFVFSLLASFFFIDVLGRRNSLFTGVTLQMLSDIYLAVYISIQQQMSVSQLSSEAALLAIFIHAFGYTIGRFPFSLPEHNTYKLTYTLHLGLLTLPYVFGGELWPNRIRSFGAAVSQSFHWLFHYAMTFALPSLLSHTHDWGAFVFFASWCFAALLYVFLLVPEIAGLSVEEIEEVFRGPWTVFGMRAARRQRHHLALDGHDQDDARSFDLDRNASVDH